jgi:hypothetical protein
MVAQDWHLVSAEKANGMLAAELEIFNQHILVELVGQVAVDKVLQLAQDLEQLLY